MSKKLPYPAHLASGYPRGTKADRRRIKYCSTPDSWYNDKIGEIITVYYFATFGAYDTEGRWLCYYDLSAPVAGESWILKIMNSIKTFFSKLFSK
jgi:hypothetical protein